MRLRSGYLACAFTFCAAVTTANGTTLGDAIATAYTTNPNLLAARDALKAVDEDYVQAQAQLGPSVVVGTTLQYEQLSGSQVGLGADGRYHLAGRTASYDLSIVQPIYEGGRLRAGLTAAKAAVLAGRENLRQTEYNLLNTVVAAYAAVCRDELRFRIANDTLAALASQHDEVSARVRVKESTLTDLAQTVARYNEQRSAVNEAAQQLEVSRSQYLAVVGERADNLEMPNDLEGLPIDVNQAFDAAERLNSALKAAQYSEASSFARIAEVKAAFRPTVTARVDLGAGPAAAYFPGYGYQNTVSASAQFSQPLYAAGMNSSQVRQAIDVNNRDRQNIEAARRQAMQAVTEAWTQLATARQDISNDVDIVRAERAAVYGVNKERPEGLRTTLDVLNAQQELAFAEQAFSQHQYDQFVAEVSLLTAMGTLDVRTLSHQVKLYRADKVFNREASKNHMPWTDVVAMIDSIGAAPTVHAPPPLLPELRPRLGIPLPPAPTQTLQQTLAEPLTPPDPEAPISSHARS
jgi:outer membrane protein